MSADTLVHLDGRPATVDDLAPLAFAGFAHFTAMQVRDGCVRGLDLHLTRLRSASDAFFGVATPDERIRALMRTALAAGPRDRSLTVTMFSRHGEFTAGTGAEEPAVLIRTSPPAHGPTGPLRLATVRYERPLPAIKHVGEATKTFSLRQAVRQGFDDAAFVDASGRLSEATIWNLVFWDGTAAVWPDAPMLVGVTMGIVQRQLMELGVPQHREAVTPGDLGRFAGAAVMNSWTPGIALAGIGPVALPEAGSFLDLLHDAYRAEPPVSP